MAPIKTNADLRTIIFRTLVALVIIGILGFAGSRTYGAFAGPKLFLSSPPDGATTSASVLVAGYGKRLLELRVNGAVVPTTPRGEFQEVVGLSVGYNAITVSGRDRLGKTITLTRILIRE